jgi:leukotriene-A4 hydrolase
LVPNLEGIDPDDAFSAVPYEKGFSLLTYLTDIAGGPDQFEDFAKVTVTHPRALARPL